MTLSNEKLFSSAAATLPQNRERNRYNNVLPCEYTHNPQSYTAGLGFLVAKAILEIELCRGKNCQDLCCTFDSTLLCAEREK